MKYRFALCTLGLFTASVLIADTNETQLCERGDRTQRITFKHREANGIGYPTGYTSAEGFFSTSKTPNLLAFADVRAHVFNDSKKAYNLGVGFRSLIESRHAVLGANVFYDYRDGLHRAFNQIGVGLEILGTKWGLRANGYIPVHHTKKKYHDGFSKFKESSAIFSKRYEFAFIGCEVALDRELVKMKNWDLDAKVAGYWFNGDFGKNAGGGLFELSTNITRYLTLKGQASYDTLFRGVFQGEAAINFPFGWRFDERDTTSSCSVIKDLEDRLIESVDRFEMIVTSTKRKKAAAIDPLTGQPLTFIFVNNTSHSLGTFESPYPTLAQAITASQPNNVIYIFPGDGTSNGLNAGPYTLKNNQKLIGSAAPLTVTTAFGLRTIPAQTLTAPSITSSGSAIALANNNTIRGLNISTSGGSGITGTTISGVEISDNAFNTSATAISISALTNIATITNNGFTLLSGNAVTLTATTNQCNFIVTDNSMVATAASGDAITLTISNSTGSLIGSSTVARNTISGQFGGGIFLQVGGTAQATAVIESNEITKLRNTSGIIINVTTNGSLNATVAKNQISQMVQNGILISTDTNGFASANIFDNLVTQANLNAGANPGILLEAFDQSIFTARLADNNSSALNGQFGYNLRSPDAPVAVLFVETPTPTSPQTGLQAINVGTFNPASFTDGVIFVPFVP